MPGGFLLVESKTMNRMDNDRHPGEFCGEAADEPCFGIVRVNHVARTSEEVAGEVQDRQSILQGVEGLHQAGHGFHFHAMALNQLNEGSAGRTRKNRFVTAPSHALHGQECVDSRPTDDGQRVYVEDFDHRPVALPPFPESDLGDRNLLNRQTL